MGNKNERVVFYEIDVFVKRIKSELFHSTNYWCTFYKYHDNNNEYDNFNWLIQIGEFFGVLNTLRFYIIISKFTRLQIYYRHIYIW